jgi:hypothetical protein
MTTQEAIDHLEREGYSVENLWHRSDVRDNFHCTDEQADEILDRALTDEWVCDQIRSAIRSEAEILGVKQKEDAV